MTDMGLGKTFTSSEKAIELGKNILVICQKSKVNDWVNHFVKYYELDCNAMIYDLTKWKKSDWNAFKNDTLFQNDWHNKSLYIMVINYDLVFRRLELNKLTDFTLVLDESSCIQNEKNNRAKFILNKLNPTNTILLSGTPINGKYEKIWSQCRLLGWNIDKVTFEKHYCIKDFARNKRGQKILGPTGFPVKQIIGYKNVDRLKEKLRQYGAHFLKTEQVFDLPEQMFYTINIDSTKEYKKFVENKIITIDTLNLCEFHDTSDFWGKDVTPRTQLVGDTSLTKLLYQRMLCGQYNKNKLDSFEDLIASTEDRIIVFYNFNDELLRLKKIAEKYDKPISQVNGSIKNLENYEYFDNSITFVQYQAGAMGLNLQKANKLIYFTPPLSSELYEQSKKRIHRIGQTKTCFYYNLTCKNSIEEKIYRVLATLNDYTEELFKEDYNE